MYEISKLCSGGAFNSSSLLPTKLISLAWENREQ